MSTSGGVNSGFGMLLVVSIAASSLLITGRTALVLAAMASLAVLGSEIYALEHALVPKASFTQGGLLGAIFHSLWTMNRRSGSCWRSRSSVWTSLVGPWRILPGPVSS
jgi:hypothetical protein